MKFVDFNVGDGDVRFDASAMFDIPECELPARYEMERAAREYGRDGTLVVGGGLVIQVF